MKHLKKEQIAEIRRLRASPTPPSIKDLKKKFRCSKSTILRISKITPKAELPTPPPSEPGLPVIDERPLEEEVTPIEEADEELLIEPRPSLPTSVAPTEAPKPPQVPGTVPGFISEDERRKGSKAIAEMWVMLLDELLVDTSKPLTPGDRISLKNATENVAYYWFPKQDDPKIWALIVFGTAHAAILVPRRDVLKARFRKQEVKAPKEPSPS